jgi:glucose-1-phosphate cytidylyltransferase
MGSSKENGRSYPGNTAKPFMSCDAKYLLKEAYTMKVVILAGGFGTRISEESQFKPKPMIEIADKPILWHIMKYYAHFGFHEFVVCLGYKSNIIKDFFANYYMYDSDIEFDLSDNSVKLLAANSEDWKVTLAETGLNTMTGGRLKRVAKYIKEDTFMMTYGDAVSDVDLNQLIQAHKSSGKIATITAVKPEGRFGVLEIDKDNAIRQFNEKNKADNAWINGGFMVLDRKVFDYIEGDQTVFERKPLEDLAKEGQLGAFEHNGFWQCMDTQRDKQLLEQIWLNNPPWKVW